VIRRTFRRRNRRRCHVITVSANVTPNRYRSTMPTPFSNRDSVGCDANDRPVTGSRSSTSLCTGSSPRRPTSLQSA